MYFMVAEIIKLLVSTTSLNMIYWPVFTITHTFSESKKLSVRDIALLNAPLEQVSITNSVDKAQIVASGQQEMT